VGHASQVVAQIYGSWIGLGVVALAPVGGIAYRSLRDDHAGQTIPPDSTSGWHLWSAFGGALFLGLGLATRQWALAIVAGLLAAYALGVLAFKRFAPH
jgi:hypothetical protein